MMMRQEKELRLSQATSGTKEDNTLGEHLNLLSAYSVFPNRCPFRKKHQAKTCKGSKNRQSDLTKISGRAFWVNDYTAHFTGFFNIQCS